MNMDKLPDLMNSSIRLPPICDSSNSRKKHYKKSSRSHSKLNDHYQKYKNEEFLTPEPTPREESDYELDMIVEIPSNSYIKYEKCPDGTLKCDRVLHTAMAYPGNYGYIPHTLAGDNDPTDIILLTDYKLFPGTRIKCRILGVLLTRDENGYDEKILAVPCHKVDPHYDIYHTYEDLPKVIISKVEHFFKHYKDNEEDKWVEIHGFESRDFAITLINDHQEEFKKNT